MMEASVCPVFLHDIISWSKGRAAAFYGLWSREAHTWHPLSVYAKSPHLYSWSYSGCWLRFFLLALWLSVYISMFLLSSLTFYTHFYLSCVCMANEKREAVFQKLNMFQQVYIYFHQGSFHFNFSVLVILIFRKILADMQGFGSTSHIINV